jgi:hypothetical protein
VFFNVPGVIFDFDSFSFQVPICGSAAKHTAPVRKENARVNPIVLIFMRTIESGFLTPVNIFRATQRAQKSAVGSIVLDCSSVEDSD